jgi:MFS transporter, ACS family, tartrate transporter
MAAGKPVPMSDVSGGTIRKIRNRLIPLLFLLYLVAALDRANIGFASLTMNADLGITAAQFGLLAGIFLLGLLLI